MKVVMLRALQGPALSLSVGATHEFPDAEAQRLVAAGIAAPEDASTSGNARTRRRERAVAAPLVERAVETDPGA